MLRLFTFGGLRFEQEGQALQLPTQKARELLGYLLTFRGRPHPRPVLAGILWPDLPEENARRYLSDVLWRSRRVAGDSVAANEECIWFNTELPYWLDVEEFEQTAACRDRPAGLAADLTEGTLRLAHACDLYRGPYLDGIYQDWALLEQERLRGTYLDLLADLLERHKQAGDYPAALNAAQRIVAAEPLYEAAHRELMRLLHLLGRDAEAIAQYQRCREILQADLDVPPAAETEALYRILIHRVPVHLEGPTAHLPAPAARFVPDLDSLPLVGRDAERRILLGYLEDLARGRGGMVLLEGEAGIGKSRLAREVAADARWRNISVLLVSAAGTGLPSSSFALLLAALSAALTPLRARQLAGVVEMPHLQAAATLLPRLAQVLPDLPPPVQLPPPQARERQQQALVALVLGLSRIAPHLWVLEDLPWADAETLSFLPVLQPHLTGSRALFLLTARSEDLRASQAVWKTVCAMDRAGHLPHHELPRLHREDVADLARHLLGEDVQEVAGCLAEQSEGVPLYLVEILKAWRDEGYLQPTARGTWRCQGDAPAGPPARLGATVITQRLSRLSADAREVLSTAATLGTTVDYDLLSLACASLDLPPEPGDSAPRLLAATDELLGLGMLVEADAGYQFSHERVRQVVYSSMSPSRRRRLHLRAAQGLESLWPEQYELLAHHYAAAGERDRAIPCLQRAAERARALYAHQAALACYDRLLDLLSGTEDRPARHDVLDHRAEVLGWVGDREAQGRTLEEMLSLAQALADEARWARTLHLRSEWYRLQGHHGRAEEDAQAALEIYRRLGDDRARAALLSQIGHSVTFADAGNQAIACFDEALAIYRALGDPEGQIDCLSGLSAAAEADGDYSLVLSYLQENLRLAETTGDPLRLGRVLHNLGVVYHDLGEQTHAWDCLRRALLLKESVGDRRGQALTHFYLGVVATERDDLETAQTHLRNALEVLREVRDLSWEGDALAALGRLALLQGCPAAALAHLEAAYQRRREMGEPSYAVVDLSCLALAQLHLGDKAAAWEHSREAVAEFEAGLAGVEHPQWLYHNHFCVAEATHRWSAARAALEEAARIVAVRAERITDPALRATFLTGTRGNRAIMEALRTLPPSGCLRVHLPSKDVPAQRSSDPEEMVTLVWTVDAGRPDADREGLTGRVGLRRHRLVRLLAEAEAAAAVPSVADLAGALDISSRTIRADLAALRRQGHSARTRGTPSH